MNFLIAATTVSSGHYTHRRPKRAKVAKAIASSAVATFCTDGGCTTTTKLRPWPADAVASIVKVITNVQSTFPISSTRHGYPESHELKLYRFCAYVVRTYISATV